MFSFPVHFDHSVISELENHIIEICNTCKTYPDISAAAAPVWDWASKIIPEPIAELRHEIESHEADEHFPDQYSEEKDHLLKIPLLLLEHINSR
ncbi:hypothetical protein A2397_00955 [Candidatus Amesbacteria bacterium RIFOXYB1_FULL_44_23]|uniref:Uncharacterized protein n=1 Tax=Candidatus Amesbacteria bacterium RIFOXYB1_FULL_44_23 TaxID=1797263 RepID=A0A1F4ZT64_9BACT|nr:MAG: hypothetical protein A2397_00955 [Candidatus Amesbacteria bacterium RIFOXYB1_FULL_44_23]